MTDPNGYLETNRGPYGFLEETPFTRQRVSLTEAVPRELVANLRYSVEEVDFLKDQLLMTLSTQVWTHQLPPEQVSTRETFTIETPASWWQHLKNDYSHTWWCGWLARWRPPVMTEAKSTATLTVDLTRWYAYPAAPAYAEREMGPAVRKHDVRNNVTWRNG